MNEASQPVRGGGTLVSALAMVAALVAFLLFAPAASAAVDPVGSGSTQITLNQALFKKLKKNNVKVQRIKPATVKGKRITLPINPEGSSIDPTVGNGLLNHRGGFRFKAGKRKVVVKNLVIDTTRKALTGQVGKKKIKIAAVAAVSFAREGFGLAVVGKKLRLTKRAANLFNKGLKKKKLFKANKSLGSATAKEQPKTVTVTGGSATLTTDANTVKKLAGDNVDIEVIAPTNVATKAEEFPPAYTFPIIGGAIAPDLSTGRAETAGGLKLIQDWAPLPPDGCATPVSTTMTLNAIWVDVGAKTASVEVTVESTVDPKANLGALGRSSIADISLAGAGVLSDAASRTIVVTGATATLQAVTAETLNALFYEVAKTFDESPCGAVTEFDPQSFAAGEGLGSFSMSVNTQ